MKIYLDYIFLINFLFDFILLTGVSFILKRNVSKLKLFFGSLFGSFSFFIILFDISSLVFFFLKMFLGFVMIIITFSYKNIRYTMNNFVYLIILSVLVGGSLYLFKIEYSYSHIGMLFFKSGKTLDLVILFLGALLVTVLYSRFINRVRKDNKFKYDVTLYLDDNKFCFKSFYDTGNDLTYFNRPVIIMNKDFGSIFNTQKIYYIPFATVEGTGVMKAVKLRKIYVSGKGFFENIYLGISNDKFHLGECDIILNVNLWEEDDYVKKSCFTFEKVFCKK